MKTIISSLILLCSCDPTELRVIDDFIEGEAEVAEQIISDISQQEPPTLPAKRPTVHLKK